MAKEEIKQSQQAETHPSILEQVLALLLEERAARLSANKPKPQRGEPTTGTRVTFEDRKGVRRPAYLERTFKLYEQCGENPKDRVKRQFEYADLAIEIRPGRWTTISGILNADDMKNREGPRWLSARQLAACEAAENVLKEQSDK